MPVILTAIIIAALAIAVYTDLRSQRISNKLTFSLALAGLLFHGLTQSMDGLLFSLSGLGLGLAVMLVPYLFGFMAGGDVKLMAALGACLGASDIFTAFIFTSIAGGVYALAVLAFRLPLLREVLRRVWTALWLFTVTKKMEYAPVETTASGAAALPKLCYGVAIAAGTLAAMIYSHQLGPLF